MQIQVNTDGNIEASDTMIAEVDTAVRETLDYLSEKIT